MIDKKWNNERKTNTPLVLNAEEKFFGFLDSHQVNLLKYLQIPKM